METMPRVKSGEHKAPRDTSTVTKPPADEPDNASYARRGYFAYFLRGRWSPTTTSTPNPGQLARHIMAYRQAQLRRPARVSLSILPFINGDKHRDAWPDARAMSGRTRELTISLVFNLLQFESS